MAATWHITSSRSFPESTVFHRTASYIWIQPVATGGLCSSIRCRWPSFFRLATICAAASRCSGVVGSA